MSSECREKLPKGLADIADDTSYSLSGTFINFVDKNKALILEQTITNVILLDKQAVQAYTERGEVMKRFEVAYNKLYKKLTIFLRIILAITSHWGITSEDGIPLEEVKEESKLGVRYARPMTAVEEPLRDELRNICVNLGNFLLRGIENMSFIKMQLSNTRVDINSAHNKRDPPAGDYYDYPKDGIIGLTWPQLAAESPEDAEDSMEGVIPYDYSADGFPLPTDQRIPALARMYYINMANMLIYPQYKVDEAKFTINLLKIDDTARNFARAVVDPVIGVRRTTSAPEVGVGGKRGRFSMGNRVYLVTVPNDGNEVVMVRKGNEVLVEETSME